LGEVVWVTINTLLKTNNGWFSYNLLMDVGHVEEARG